MSLILSPRLKQLEDAAYDRESKAKQLHLPVGR